MERRPEFLGFDLDDAVYVPAGRGLELFDRENVVEIDILFRATTTSALVERRIERLLLARHGMEDFTITSQQQMLDVLGSVLTVLTFAVGALGGISLLVAGVGILTIMTIAIRERTGEIGLLRAIGATRGHILVLFLSEAAALVAEAVAEAVATTVGLVAGVAPALHAARLDPVEALRAE